MNYGSSGITSGITMGKVLSGIYKSLGVANQVIPLYKQTMPLIRNVRSAYKIIKEFNSETSKTSKKNSSKPSSLKAPNKTLNPPKEKTITTKSNSPTFFI